MSINYKILPVLFYFTVALMLRVDSVMLDHRKPKSYFVVEGTKVVYIQQNNKVN
jgi:hypothetical protein